MKHKNVSRKGNRHSRSRIVNKLRFTTFCIFCIVSIIVVSGILGSASASKYNDTYTITISFGDTLWDIARENNTVNKDVRRVVDDIVKLNNLKSTSLSEGDKIIVPIY